MRKALQRIFRFIYQGCKVFCAFLFIYFLAIKVFGVITVNRSFAQSSPGIPLMVINNGIHTDLVIPVKTNVIDWRKHIDVKDYAGADSAFKFIALGWGSRKFYLETPEWKDLRPEVALAAAFGLGKSAMHVYYLKNQPKQTKDAVLINISTEQYQSLIAHILQSFQHDKEGNFRLIASRGYSDTDNFYEANGVYSLLKPCNSWTNSALKSAGVKTVLWAPVPHFMMRKLRKYTAKQQADPSLSLLQ